MSKGTIAHLCTSDLKAAPQPSTLLGLSNGLQLPLSSIQQAVAEALGLVYMTDDSSKNKVTRALVDTVEKLSPRDRQTVLRLAMGMLRDSANH